MAGSLLRALTDPAQQVFLKVEFDVRSFFLYYSQDLDCGREQMFFSIRTILE